MTVETLNLMLDNGTGKYYDAGLEDTLPQASPMTVITKHNATKDGKTGVLVLFAVQLPDGSTAYAQATTTARLFINAAKAIEAAEN